MRFSARRLTGQVYPARCLNVKLASCLAVLIGFLPRTDGQLRADRFLSSLLILGFFPSAPPLCLPLGEFS